MINKDNAGTKPSNELPVTDQHSEQTAAIVEEPKGEAEEEVVDKDNNVDTEGELETEQVKADTESQVTVEEEVTGEVENTKEMPDESEAAQNQEETPNDSHTNGNLMIFLLTSILLLHLQSVCKFYISIYF